SASSLEDAGDLVRLALGAGEVLRAAIRVRRALETLLGAGLAIPIALDVGRGARAGGGSRALERLGGGRAGEGVGLIGRRALLHAGETAVVAVDRGRATGGGGVAAQEEGAEKEHGHEGRSFHEFLLSLMFIFTHGLRVNPGKGALG